MAKRLRRIVIATDFSAGSAAAVSAFTTTWRIEGGAHVHLLHVVEPTAFAPAPPLWVDYDRARVEDARVRLEREAKRLRARLDSKAKLRTLLVIGSPYAEICRAAATLGADVILIGTHGRTGLRRALIGSVAERVVRHAGRPVLTVPLARVRAGRR